DAPVAPAHRGNSLSKSVGGCGLVPASPFRTIRAGQLFSAAAAFLLLPTALGSCFHSSQTIRPARHVNYWEALAELHPADAIAAAHTPSETEFAEALNNLMCGDIEKAEQRFSKLRTSASDSFMRAGSRVVYGATLQSLEKWLT